MIAELIESLRLTKPEPGYVVEVHLDPDCALVGGKTGGWIQVRECGVTKFLDEWDTGLMGRASRFKSWIGIIHEDGAMLVEFPT